MNSYIEFIKYFFILTFIKIIKKNFKFKLFHFALLTIFSLISQSAFADSASGSFFCTSGQVCRMSLKSDYNGHSIDPSYNYDITGWKNGDVQVQDNIVNSDVTYLFRNGGISYAQNLKIPLNGVKNSYSPAARPDSSDEVRNLSETVTATFINESSVNKTATINIKHDYGQNSDTFTYTVTVLPPPPVCTTTVNNANLDMGTFTTSQLLELAPGQSIGVNKSVKVFSQCSYSSGVNISLSTNKANSTGNLVGGGGVNFLTEIDGKKTLFGNDGRISFSVNSGSHAFELGFTAVRSDEKPMAGTFSNIITITTTPL
ncbi:hypothetical protein [Pantoea stewartii]|uniref:hypothetical protein n=1 Tax=Pantoea stewartii TaxID=66269 RepID=UPI000B13FC8E|nr:hypothetical protein [Pantoea stewartii]